MWLALVHLDLEVCDAAALPESSSLSRPDQVSPPVENYRGWGGNDAPTRGEEVVAIVALLVPCEEVEARCSEFIGLEGSFRVQAVESPVVEVW